MSAPRPGDNYYEDQFGDRIRNISKGGTKPPAPPSGSGGGKAKGGLGVVVIIIIIVVKAIAGWNSSSPRTHYNYTPPPQIQVNPQVNWPQRPIVLPPNGGFDPDANLDDGQNVL